jgi:hypothetical protein
MELNELDSLSLKLNAVIFGSVSRVLEQINDEEHFMRIIRSAYHAVAPENPDPILAAQSNILGLALEHKLNLPAMLAESDKIKLEIEQELNRRSNASS